jgi:hypothetical protein
MVGMSERYIISLNVEARRQQVSVDLEKALTERFSSEHVHVLKRGLGGRTVVVEMADRWIDAIRKAFPYVTVSADGQINLLDRSRT